MLNFGIGGTSMLMSMLYFDSWAPGMQRDMQRPVI